MARKTSRPLASTALRRSTSSPELRLGSASQRASPAIGRAGADLVLRCRSELGGDAAEAARARVAGLIGAADAAGRRGAGIVDRLAVRERAAWRVAQAVGELI